MDDMEILEKLTAKSATDTPKQKRKRTDSQRAAEVRYKEKNQKNVTVAFLPPTMPLYDYLKSASDKAGITPAQYIRELLREDMEHRGQKEES